MGFESINISTLATNVFEKYASKKRDRNNIVSIAEAYIQAISDLERERSIKSGKLNKKVNPVMGGECLSLSSNKISDSGQNVLSMKGQQTEGSNELQILESAIRDLQERYHSQCSSGVRKGIEIIHFQHALTKGGLSPEEKGAICEKIARIFEGAESYLEMYDLRETIDSLSLGTSSLHKLVYVDVDVDTCHRILKSINQNVQKAYAENPAQIKFKYMIYSDIDDTIKGSLNDRGSAVEGFYPSAMEFYKQFALTNPNDKLQTEKSAESDAKASEPDFQNVGLTFLSARPKAKSNMWNKKLKGKLPDGTKFFGLYGSTSAFVEGVKHYIIKLIVSLAEKILPEFLRKRVIDICNSSEAQTYISFALDKRQNMDRDLVLRPEVRPIMIGDCGEGDLIFLLMKNSGVPIPLDDERIPEEYRYDEKWNDRANPPDQNSPVNPTNRPLFQGFAHAISSPTSYDVRPDPQYRDEYLSLNTSVFDNYVDNTLYCLQQGIFDLKTADKIVEESRAWIKKNEHAIESMKKKRSIQIDRISGTEIEGLPAAVKYRVKLLRSLNAYDEYVRNLPS